MSLAEGKLNRRRMLGSMGALGAGAALAAPAAIGLSGATVSAATANLQDLTNDEMDAEHEKGVKAFPAATAGKGGQPLEPIMDGDVKVFNLTCQAVEWEYMPGKTVEAWTYNGTVPGPEIRVTEGDKIRIIVKNDLAYSTAVHFHGLILPNAMDGVPFITQPPIKPGEAFIYEWQIRDGNTGSHMYHSHHNSAEQTTKGLLGPFIVESKDPNKYPAHDVEYTMVLNDGPIGGYSLNGKGFPATEPIVVKKGQKLLVRYMNEGLMIHPMHLHGMPQQVVARDGFPLPSPYFADTIEVDPGQRTDVLIDCTEVGVWAYHCHVLSHAEGPTGMFGMVTALIVQE